MPKKAKVDTKKKYDVDRKFCCSTYIERDKVISFLRCAEWVQHWAIIEHHSDVNEDGTPKKIHTHILLYTYDAKTPSAIRKRFDGYSIELYKNTEQGMQNTMVDFCYDMAVQWRYLIHKDDVNKFQYDIEEVVCDDLSYWYKLEKSSGLTDSAENYGYQMLRDYLDDTPPLVMVQRYGKEYLYHLTHLQKCAVEVYRYESRKRVEQYNIKDLMQMCLETSPIDNKVIADFWVCYDYIVSQINQNYNSKIDFYLTENVNK